MITLLIVAVLAVASALFGVFTVKILHEWERRHAEKRAKREWLGLFYDYSYDAPRLTRVPAYWGAVWTAAAAVCVFVATAVPLTVIHIDMENTVDRIGRDLEIVEAREADLEATIRAELDRFPELELDLFDSIDPVIILSYPQLRSTDVLVEKTNQLVELRDRRWQLELERSDLQRRLDNFDDNPFVYTLS